MQVEMQHLSVFDDSNLENKSVLNGVFQFDERVILSEMHSVTGQRPS